MWCQNEFDPQWMDIECYWFKPPHDLQHMHLKLTKHGRFCKQNNQLPTKTHDELKDNSIVYIPLKWWVIFLKSRTSTDYFSNSTGSYETSLDIPISEWETSEGDTKFLHTMNWCHQKYLGSIVHLNTWHYPLKVLTINTTHWQACSTH